MTIKSILLFTKSLIFPKTEKKSLARRSISGALICIGLSIIPLTCVLCITNGMIEGMTERLIGLSTGHIQAFVAQDIKETRTFQNFFAFAEKLKKQEGIISAYPEVDINAIGTANDYRSGIQIRGVNTDIFKDNHSFRSLFEVIEGDDLEISGSEAIVGKKIAELLNLHAGDTFRIITTRTVKDKLVPKLTPFKVKAIISSGYQEMDALWTFIPIETAFASLSLSNANFTVLMETPDAFSPELTYTKKCLQSDYGEIANFYSWQQVHQSEFENFSSTKVMLVLIMVLIVLVASINICSAIIMLVMERKKEIAILKSIGATPFGITLSFLLTAVVCGSGGVILGLVTGLLLSVNANQIISFIEKTVNHVAKIKYLIQGVPLDQMTQIHLMDPAYYIQTIPLEIPFGQIFLICALTIFLSLIVSIIPSVKAGKEKPIDTLRKA
jgi:lipoprotein-releasing system permease protein